MHHANGRMRLSRLNNFQLGRRLRPLVLGLAVISAATLLAACEFFVASVAPTPTLVSSASSSSRPLVAVERGTIEEAIRATGRVVAQEREDLFFQSGGRIKIVNVRQGALVSTGDVLAELETGSLDSQVATAEEAFESASLQVNKSEQALTNEVASIQQQLFAARNDVIRKLQALDYSVNGGDPELVSSARSRIVAAEKAVTDTQFQLSIINANPGVIRGALVVELQRLRDHLVNLEDELSYLLSQGAPSAAEALAEANLRLAELQNDVEVAQANLQLADENLDRALNGASGDDLERAQLIFRRAEIAYENSLERNFSGDQREQFRISYDLARLAYESAVNPGDESGVAKARVARNQVQVALDGAISRLRGTVNDGDASDALNAWADRIRAEYPQQVAAAQLAVFAAQRAISRSELELSNIDAGRGSIELQAALAANAQAGLSLGLAQLRLSELLNPTDSTIEIVRNEMDMAVVRADNLQERFEQFATGESQKDIDLTIANNNFEQARIRLGRLQEQTFENLIVAPFDGEVTFVKGRAGDQVPAYQEIVGLSNPETLVIESLIPEVDYEKLSIGQAVDVQLDAFPGRNFVGRVTSLPRQIISSTGQAISIPETEIEVEWGQAAVELGMLARIKITVQIKENVLKVPAGAVRRVNAREFVETVVDGQRRSIQVVTGISSDTDIEIESGLDEGMQIYASL